MERRMEWREGERGRKKRKIESAYALRHTAITLGSD